MSILDTAISYLACPNDHGLLTISLGKLSCQSCKTEFRILNENTIELLPNKSFQFETNQTNKVYSKYYSDLREAGHPTDQRASQWGLKSKSIPSGFVFNLRNTIMKMIDNSIVCDVGAGNGDYSLVFAKKSKMVFHCDLNLDAINTSREEAKKQHLNNILFIRCDYLSLPFRTSSIPSIVSIDTLERGQEHDAKLMEQITSKIMKGGLVIVDFHSKERTKLTHALDLENRYSKNEILTLLSTFNLRLVTIKGLGHLPQIRNFSTFSYEIGNFICRLFFPPARWLVVARKI